MGGEEWVFYQHVWLLGWNMDDRPTSIENEEMRENVIKNSLRGAKLETLEMSQEHLLNFAGEMV